jgi:hypothetical protein
LYHCDCVDPFIGKHCENYNGSTTHPTTRHTTTTSPPGEGPYKDCELNNPCTDGSTAGGDFYYPHEDPTKYVQCSEWGQCYIMNCSAGLIWDDVNNTCNWPGPGGPWPTVTSPHPPTHTRPTTKLTTTTSYRCEMCTTDNMENGDFLFPHDDPSKYVECFDWLDPATGSFDCKVHDCPSGQVWNDVVDACIWPASPIPTSAQTHPTTSPPGPGRYDCHTRNPCTPDNTADGDFYFSHDDPNKFVQCSDCGHCTVMFCPAGLLWDDIANTCNCLEDGNPGPGQGYDCGTRNPCTDGSTASGDFYFPHDDSNKFVQCSEWGQCYIIDCHPGLIWDDVNNTCNWPAKPFNPKPPSSRPKPGRPIVPQEEVPEGYNCENNNPCTPENVKQNKFYFAYNQDRSKFVQCSEWGQCYVMPCGPGTAWNVEHNTCGHP